MVATEKIIGIGIDRTPLRQLVKQMPNPTREKVKMLYGDIGVDIFEGKDKITILEDKDIKKTKGFMNNFINWFKNNKKLDYEESDSIKDLVLKDGYNNNNRTYEEIEAKFGKEGRRVVDIFALTGFFNRTGI